MIKYTVRFRPEGAGKWLTGNARRLSAEHRKCAVDLEDAREMLREEVRDTLRYCRPLSALEKAVIEARINQAQPYDEVRVQHMTHRIELVVEV